jgi:hypothetical protein
MSRKIEINSTIKRTIENSNDITKDNNHGYNKTGDIQIAKCI